MLIADVSDSDKNFDKGHEKIFRTSLYEKLRVELKKIKLIRKLTFLLTFNPLHILMKKLLKSMQGRR